MSMQNRGNVRLLGSTGGGGGGGDVVGPAVATHNALARFNGPTGELLKDSPDLIYDDTSVTVGGKILSRKALNEIEVFAEEDFPAVFGGVITLPSGLYVLKENVTLANPLRAAAGATVEITSGGLSSTITYTGTDPFLQNVAGALFITLTRMTLVLTEDTVELFDTDGPAILFDRIVIAFAGSGGGLGTSLNHNLAFSIRNSLITGFSEGITASGSPLFLLADAEFRAPVLGASPLFSVDGGTTTIQLSNLAIDAHASAEIFEFDPGFNGFATLSQIRNLGASTFFAVGSLDETAPRIFVTDSPPQKSSENIGFVHANNNVTATVINTQNVFEDLNLNALAVPGSSIELWSVSDSTTGELTYDGLTPFNGAIFASITGVSQGSADEFIFRALKNGSPLSDGIIASTEIGNTARALTLIAPITAVTGDTIKVQVTNADGISDITIRQFTAEIT